MKLAGLDFETANYCNGSICAAGCAILENGVPVERKEWFIKPHSTVDWMMKACYDVHGISYWDLRDSPEFDAIWPELQRMLLSADFVVIHNAPFDLRHLRQVLTIYALPPVSFNYVCSLAMSRSAFPQLNSHSLDVVAEYLGFTFRHHDALEDAFACATIASKINFQEKFQKTFTTIS